jgi:hypothetical protein
MSLSDTTCHNAEFKAKVSCCGKAQDFLQNRQDFLQDRQGDAHESMRNY